MTDEEVTIALLGQKLDAIEKSVNSLNKLIRGDNGGGVRGKLTGLVTQVRIQWFVMTFIITTIVWILKS